MLTIEATSDCYCPIIQIEFSIRDRFISSGMEQFHMLKKKEATNDDDVMLQKHMISTYCCIIIRKKGVCRPCVHVCTDRLL